MLKLIETQYHGDGLEESNRFSILAMIVLVFFLVSGIGWATYLFIDASGVSNAADVHITKGLLLGVSSLKGDLYTNESLGIKDWMVHADNANGFELKYPNDWEVRTASPDGALLFLKAYKKSSNKSVSLLMTVETKESDEASKDKSINAIASQEGFSWDDNWKEEEIGGRIGIRTGKIKTTDGFVKDSVFWKSVEGTKGFYLEATYYTNNINDAIYNEAVFDKVVSEFKFL
jgi:hypothetical protein